jgi:hypothetical protein
LSIRARPLRRSRRLAGIDPRHNSPWRGPQKLCRDPRGGHAAGTVRYSLPVAVHGARIINLRKISDPKGNLTPIEGSIDVPFEIRRVYYTYDIPGGETRGGHAHRRIQEFVIAASGSFSVTLFDGENRETFYLNRSYYGLLIPEMVWRELTDFSSGSVCLVLASGQYDEGEYIRDVDEFNLLVRK